MTPTTTLHIYTHTHAHILVHTHATHKVNVLGKDHPFQILGPCDFCIAWMQLGDNEFYKLGNKTVSNLLHNLAGGCAGHSRGRAPCKVLIRQRAVSVPLTPHPPVKAQHRDRHMVHNGTRVRAKKDLASD